ncbi:hypothetical protein J4558_00270 [Leptolyngbya sp. 15MV]|nr:hypothetical protein J4558_00270 [Leptolyngbya sp. 15MV]
MASTANAQIADPEEVIPEPSEQSPFELHGHQLPLDSAPVRDPFEQQRADPATRTADASLGEVGKRLSKEEVSGAPNPHGRINARLDTRIEGRIQSRLDQNHETVEENQEDQRRRLRPRS